MYLLVSNCWNSVIRASGMCEVCCLVYIYISQINVGTFCIWKHVWYTMDYQSTFISILLQLASDFLLIQFFNRLPKLESSDSACTSQCFIEFIQSQVEGFSFQVWFSCSVDLGRSNTWPVPIPAGSLKIAHICIALHLALITYFQS